jgi:hypothetical protein
MEREEEIPGEEEDRLEREETPGEGERKGGGVAE